MATWPSGRPLRVILATAAIAAVGFGASYNWFLLASVPICLVGVVVIRRPDLCVITLLCVLATNDLASQVIGVGTPAGALIGIVKDVLLACLAVSLFLRQRRNSVSLPGSMVMAVLGTLAIGLIEVVRSGDKFQGLYGFRNDFEPLVLLLLVPLLISRRDTQRILTATIAIVEAAALVSVATYHIGLDWLATAHVLRDENGLFPFSYFVAGSVQPRAFSPYFGPNELGVACALGLAVILLRPHWSMRQRALLSVMPITALALSQSRSAFIGLATILVLLLMVQVRGQHAITVRIVGALVLAALAAITVLIQLIGDVAIDSSSVGHAASLVTSISLMISHPLGFGMGTVGPRALRVTAVPILTESYFLVIALEGGVIALAGYIAVLATVTMLLTRHAMHGGRLRPEVVLGPIAIAATLCNQLVLPSLQSASNSWLLWILVGTAIVHARTMAPPLTEQNARSPSTDPAARLAQAAPAAELTGPSHALGSPQQGLPHQPRPGGPTAGLPPS